MNIQKARTHAQGMGGGDQPKSKRLRTSKEGRLILAIFVRASYMDDTTTIAETK